MRASILSAFVALTTIALAAPAPVHHVSHEKRTDSAAWVKGDRVHGDVKLPVRIGLTQSNLDKGHDLLMSV